MVHVSLKSSRGCSDRCDIAVNKCSMKREQEEMLAGQRKEAQ